MVTADTEPVSVEGRQKWFEAHDSFSRPLMMIETLSGEIVGWLSFQSFYGRPAYRATAEISIYLSPDFRGKGMGRIILTHCINIAPSFGLKTLLGFIFQHNEPSLRLFRKMGFQDWGTLPDVAELDGVERSLKILGLRIVSSS